MRLGKFNDNERAVNGRCFSRPARWKGGFCAVNKYVSDDFRLVKCDFFNLIVLGLSFSVRGANLHFFRPNKRNAIFVFTTLAASAPWENVSF